MNKSGIALLFSMLLFFCFAEAAVKDSTFVLHKITVEGNERTRPFVIARELPLQRGEQISQGDIDAMLSKAHDNLMNTGLFNFVELAHQIDGKNLELHIKVEERWYLWPTLYMDFADRNINSWWDKKDLSRVNYKLGLVQQNFRGRREELGFLLQLGYEKEFAVVYDIPYLNKSKTLGLMFLADYYAYHNLKYASLDNRLFYTQLDDDYLRQNLQLTLSLKYRRNIHTSHQFTAGYHRYWLNDTLLELNSSYAPNTSESFPYFSYIMKMDYRDYKAYPLHGFYVDFSARKFGLPGSYPDYTLLKSNFRKYYGLGSNLFFAAGMVVQSRLGQRLPYYLTTERGMGYGRDFVRGMEYYVFDQTDWLYLKSNVKYRVLPQKIININFLKNKLFGEKFSKIPLEIFANVFYDTGYASGSIRDEAINPLVNQWQHGFGLGLDVLTYYDKVLRTEVSWNHRGDVGLFFHMISPI